MVWNKYGGGASSYGYNRLDNIGVWNRTLNDTEILDLQTNFYPFVMPSPSPSATPPINATATPSYVMVAFPDIFYTMLVFFLLLLFFFIMVFFSLFIRIASMFFIPAFI
jgi:hypothetical protein